MRRQALGGTARQGRWGTAKELERPDSDSPRGGVSG